MVSGGAMLSYEGANVDPPSSGPPKATTQASGDGPGEHSVDPPSSGPPKATTQASGDGPGEHSGDLLS
ncbi:unnamed protein product [Ilex paraguariensis]|uniref:Uncharacterized protein n=1 Tax=Ilex paraguariensis TaxID=185542 RepID=A0ABC8TIJ7_9AQUA